MIFGVATAAAVGVSVILDAPVVASFVDSVRPARVQPTNQPMIS